MASREVIRRADSMKAPETEKLPFSWRSSIVYEAYPAGFEKNLGNRNFLGEMTHRVKNGYFQDLGVDAIWIPPIYPSSGFDQGYDISDYKQIAKEYGGMEAFDEFVGEAHSHGIKVIMDLVVNHTSVDHAWYKEAASSRDNPKHGWYLFHEPTIDGTAPSDTLNAWGQPGWQKNSATGEYVWSSFSPEGQRDLNWENPEVRAAMMDVVDFWQDKHHVDGFRGDALPFISKDPAYYNSTSYVPNDAGMLNGPHTAEYIELIAERIGKEGILIPEASINDGLDVVAKAHGKQIFETPEEIDMVMDAIVPFHTLSGSEVAPVYFLPYYVDWDNARQIKMLYDRIWERLPIGATPTFLISDHDENARAFSRLSPQRARQAKLIEFTMPGVSIVYYGDEIRMSNQEVVGGTRRDVLGRDRGRNAFDIAEAQRQQNDPTSEFSFTRKLAEIKHTESAISQGIYRPLELREHVFGYVWEDGQEKVAILNNFSGMDIVDISLGEEGKEGVQLVTSRMDRNGELRDVSNLSLRPHESIVIRIE